MNYDIRANHGQPAYLQLYLLLRKDIVSGVYPAGSKLPSKRTLAEETGVSVITVQHAVDLLCEEGYIQTKERSGCFVIYQKNDFAGDPFPGGSSAGNEPFRSLLPGGSRAGNEPSFSLPERPEAVKAPVKQEAELSMQHAAARNPELFPFSVLTRTMHRVLLDEGENILVPAPSFGLGRLRGEICAYLQRSRGLQVRQEQVLIGSGAEYLYGLIAQFFEDPLIAVEDPSYPKIREVYEAFGKTCEALPLERDGIRSAALKACRAGILHVTPFNSYPSGATADISKKQEYLEWAGRRGGYIIEDNYDSELTVSRKTEDPLFSMEGDQNVLYINTFSRTIAPSVRIGYLVLPEKIVPAFARKLGFYSCTVPVFDQYVLAELLRSGDYERHINRQRRRRRRLME